MEVIREIRLVEIKRKKIPLKWLLFHQEFPLASKDVLSFEQCMQIASHLHMGYIDIMDSLKFFANLNVIMYLSNNS